MISVSFQEVCSGSWSELLRVPLLSWKGNWSAFFLTGSV